jgi:N-methylhydantoinase A
MKLGIDTGGTFTDIVAVEDDGTLRVEKVPSSTPGDPTGILAGIDQAIGSMDAVDLFIHGTTMATNALIEKKGATCALIATDGFRDVLELRRAHRPREGMLDIQWDPPAVLIPRRLRLTIRERIDYRGDVLVELDEDSVRAALDRCAANGVDAIAVSLINAFKNPAHERRVGELIAERLPGAYVTLSHELVPLAREFERTATVAANVFVGPQMRSYLDGVDAGCRERGLRGSLLLMQSHGGVAPAHQAAATPVRAANSGPVAGVVAATAAGASVGLADLVSFDMGGTSCDISVIRDGKPIITDESEVEFGIPVLFPSVLIETIGAGGGSIAWVDQQGHLRSGPHSAGARPGPACYGRGGTQATTTDAHVVLGTLGAQSLLAGAMDLDRDAAVAAVGDLAEQLGEDPLVTAAGIVRVANSIMEQGVRRMTLELGHDPRDLTLVAFGGAGPVHAAAVAKAMRIPQVLVPPRPGVASAIGLLSTDVRTDVIESVGVAIPRLEPQLLLDALERGARAVRTRLERDFAPGAIDVEYTLNMKYAGGIDAQTIPIPVALLEPSRTWLDELTQRYHEVHEQRFTYSARQYPVEIESVRVEGIGRIAATTPRPGARAQAAEPQSRSVFFADAGRAFDTPVLRREALVTGERIPGPAVIEQYDATTVVEPGMTAWLDEADNIRIDIEGIA